MSSENETICKYFSNLDRQGLGDLTVTLKTLRFIDNLTENSHIADIGYGTGGQTLALAENAPERERLFLSFLIRI